VSRRDGVFFQVRFGLPEDRPIRFRHALETDPRHQDGRVEFGRSQFNRCSLGQRVWKSGTLLDSRRAQFRPTNAKRFWKAHSRTVLDPRPDGGLCIARRRLGRLPLCHVRTTTRRQPRLRASASAQVLGHHRMRADRQYHLRRFDDQHPIPYSRLGVVPRRCVPYGACYTTHCCNTYIWVRADQMHHLSEFTLVLLNTATTALAWHAQQK
jgi:hypothetical protein